jgi:hypothetical protein
MAKIGSGDGSEKVIMADMLVLLPAMMISALGLMASVLPSRHVAFSLA